MVLTSFKDISGSAEASNLSKISAEASNIFKDISSVLICWFPEGGWEAKGERKPGRLRLCLIVLELKLLNAHDRYPTSLNYLSMVRNAVCILCVSYFGPFLHFFGYLSCAIFFSLLPWRVLVGGLVLEGACGWFSCLGFVGFLGPDFMGGADQVTAWNVFSVTPQSLSHLTMQWHIWQFERHIQRQIQRQCL